MIKEERDRRKKREIGYKDCTRKKRKVSRLHKKRRNGKARRKHI